MLVFVFCLTNPISNFYFNFDYTHFIDEIKHQ